MAARVLIVGGSSFWQMVGKTLLRAAGYPVSLYHVLDPREYISDFLPEVLSQALEGSDALLIEKDLGEGITSTRLICVIRREFPRLPIIRWTNESDSAKKPYMTYLGVSRIRKPNKKNETEFAKTFTDALDEQLLIRSRPMAIFAVVDETESAEHREDRTKQRALQLAYIEGIAQLSDCDYVSSVDKTWGISGGSGATTKIWLGHIICDGILAAGDIAPHLPELQKVVAKLQSAGEIDELFHICSEFIMKGNLDELELYRGCY